MPLPRAQFVLYDGFDPLDVIGPYEVLTAGSELLNDALEIKLVSAEGARAVISGTPGLALTSTGFLEPEAPGYVIVPGASGPLNDPTIIIQRLAQLAGSAAAPLLRQCLDNPALTVAAPCGGSLALAMAGLIAGRTATTHSEGHDALAATGVNAVRARVVDDGDLVSSGGVTSGIDLGLYLLEREFGPRIARAVEDYFEHERRGTPWRDIGAVPVSA
jgi:transcriptional regulator GlxA family with amidase domain